MISRNPQRLKRLEARAMTAGEPTVIEVQFVSPDKVVTASMSVTLRSERWAGASQSRTRF